MPTRTFDEMKRLIVGSLPDLVRENPGQFLAAMAGEPDAHGRVLTSTDAHDVETTAPIPIPASWANTCYIRGFGLSIEPANLIDNLKVYADRSPGTFQGPTAYAKAWTGATTWTGTMTVWSPESLSEALDSAPTDPPEPVDREAIAALGAHILECR
jgi:hypothetical protein